MKIKQLAIIITSTLVLLGTGSAMAASKDGFCIVMGYHEPGTNIYDGPTVCGNVSLSDLTVRGPLQLTKTRISGETDVQGPMQASGASVHNIVMGKQLKPVTVTLENNTNVDGSITFQGSQEGTVYLKSGSNITGSVVNGKIVRN